jgi:PAS domain S-box-containing protein
VLAASVRTYAQARERALAAMDEISTASLESATLEDLLRRLLDVFRGTTPSVDTATILLADHEGLHVRAAVGKQEELAREFSLAVGNGLAARILSERRPLALRMTGGEPMIENQAIRRWGIRALYGLPLVQHGPAIGVALMGSLTADEFSLEDRQLFGSMAVRATAAIHDHALREELARIAAERELALAKLESLLAASPVGLAFHDRELTFLRINESLAAINGRSVADHIGHHVREIVPEIADVLEPLFHHILETGEPQRNLEVARAGRTFLCNFYPVRGSNREIIGIGAVVVEVTEAKRAQDELHRERTRLRSIIEHAPAAIWLKQSDGTIVLANRQLAAALGKPLEQVVGARSPDILPPEIAAQHQAHDDMVFREGRSIEVEELAPSGEGMRTFLTIKFPIPGDPPLIGGIATEISERKVIEEQLRQAVRTREEVLAVVSHDLRNPLATVLLSASMLVAQVGQDHRARRHLDVIQRSCARMQTLIDDLLDTANLRAGKLPLVRRRESADAVAGEAVELQQSLAQEKGVVIRYERSLGGCEIDCDRDRVLQVFGNLIGNAIKFCRAGDTITVRGRTDGEQAVFSVRDTGPGIASEIVPYLFDPYWSGMRDRQRSSGLGLYISRGIVESHGGRIWVESQLGLGSTFFFTLPIVRD